MGKPLLTDEMIERARRGEDVRGPRMVDEEETKIKTGYFHYSIGRANDYTAYVTIED